MYSSLGTGDLTDFAISEYKLLLLLLLFQSISMAIQKGNAVCVMGCVKDTCSGIVHEAEEL